MAIKIQGTTVVDDQRKAQNIASVQFPDGTSISSALTFGNTVDTAGALKWTLNNPNVYSTSATDEFGSSVAIDGKYAVVGAYKEDGKNGAFAGVAYVYNIITGELVWILSDPRGYSSAMGGSAFGRAVGISGNNIIVTATADNYSGKAYIFNATTGQLVWTLDNPNAYSISSGDNFGWLVAISGNYAIISTYFEDDAGGGDSGKAYIFNVTTGNLVWTLNNPNAYSTSASDQFGYSVAISGNYAIVGANLEDDAGGSASGKAYIFNVTTGNLVWTLNNPNAYSTSASDQFGGSVAISGNYAIVGAYRESDGGTNSGKAYIYNVTTGQLVWTLNNPNAYSTSQYDNFGWSVAISGNYAIVGAYQEDDTAGSNSGKAYIFNVTTGNLVLTLNNPNPYGTSVLDYFGSSLSISGNYVIVGANQEDDAGGTNSGKAYIFSLESSQSSEFIEEVTFSNGVTVNFLADKPFQVAYPAGALVQTLNNPNAYSTSAGDLFSVSVAISGNYVIVGASSEDDASGTESGKAYIFNVTTGQLVWTLNNPNVYGTSASDNFGYSVAISGNYAIVGAYQEDDNVANANSGRAYIYNVTTGQLVWTLNNPNAYSTSNNDQFGYAVAISGNYAIVSTPFEDDAGGSMGGKAYVYNVTTGNLLWTLNNPTVYSTSSMDSFGTSVAISGNYAIIGSNFEDDAGALDSGKAYIFNVTTGTLVRTLDNPTAYGTSGLDLFGSSVAISGNYAIVGAFQEDDAGGTNSGKAYIFSITTGALIWTLNNPNVFSTSANDYFGQSVAISGNYAIVGAYQEDEIGDADSGKVYVYNVTTGQLVMTLNNPNAYSTVASDQIGGAIALSGNYAIVSAPNEDDAGGASSGKAYIFSINSQTYLDKLLTLAEGVF